MGEMSGYAVKKENLKKGQNIGNNAKLILSLN